MPGVRLIRAKACQAKRRSSCSVHTHRTPTAPRLAALACFN